MRKLFLILMALSPPLYASDDACSFDKSRTVAFTSDENVDVMRVRVEGETCKESSLELSITDSDGRLIHLHQEDFGRWQWNDLEKAVTDYAEKLFQESIVSSSTLAIDFRCEIEEPGCVPYERNVVPMEQYLEIRKSGIPLIKHSTGYESWGAWVYDKEKSEVVQVYEGNL